ncbi:MAG: hypothetical protein EHM24_14010 [Acidobacteria bacterium]|nr:MAG: hypothetical protein EHM24_14010 [Acidobacteriota bacterium]
MPRRRYPCSGGLVFHVCNRAIRRATLFHTPDDFLAFIRVIVEGQSKVDIRLLEWCLMRNNWCSASTAARPEPLAAAPASDEWRNATAALQVWTASRRRPGRPRKVNESGTGFPRPSGARACVNEQE